MAPPGDIRTYQGSIADNLDLDGEGLESEPPSPVTVTGDDWLVLDVVVEGGDWSGVGPDEDDLEHLVARVAAMLCRSAEVSALLQGPAIACVAFSEDTAVQELNKQFRGQDKPTNVLSFPAGPVVVARTSAAGQRNAVGQPGDGPREPRALGDIVLAAGTVTREAAGLGLPLAHHVQHLVVHGVLHLLGFDHESDAEAEVMEALERVLLARLGVADPYSSNE